MDHNKQLQEEVNFLQTMCDSLIERNSDYIQRHMRLTQELIYTRSAILILILLWVVWG